LRRLHADHERAAEGWTDDAVRKKRQARTARAAVMLQIQVMLGRLGEVERAGRLYRCSFERKLDELDSYVSVMASAAGPRN
ncbi:MAG TPA: hypothetical protein VFB62_22670, partial [Polyangiaceae bacterium]|nr:hypothetical protein [Polyangiaceae bacterium]